MTYLERLLQENLERAGGVLPPPPGFVPDAAPAPAAIPSRAAAIAPAPSLAPPPGFIDDDPEGTGVGRAVERGLLRGQQTLPIAEASRSATAYGRMGSDDAALLRQLYLDTTGKSEVPPDADLSSISTVISDLANRGFPTNTVAQAYEIRQMDRDAALARGGDVVIAEGVDALGRAADLQGQIEALPNSPGAEQFKQEFAAAPDTFMDALGAFLSNPVGGATFLGETAAESAPQIAAAVPATVLAGPLGGAAVMGAGAVTQEYGAGVIEFIGESGRAPKTPEEAAALLKDTRFMADANARGVGRGVTIALMEMIGQGAAGKIGRTAVQGAVADTATQAATGAGGEVTARAVTGQEQSAKAALVEGLAEPLTTPGEVIPAIIADRRANAQPPAPPPGFVPDAPVPPPAAAAPAANVPPPPPPSAPAAAAPAAAAPVETPPPPAGFVPDPEPVPVAPEDETPGDFNIEDDEDDVAVEPEPVVEPPVVAAPASVVAPTPSVVAPVGVETTPEPVENKPEIPVAPSDTTTLGVGATTEAPSEAVPTPPDVTPASTDVEPAPVTAPVPAQPAQLAQPTEQVPAQVEPAPAADDQFVFVPTPAPENETPYARSNRFERDKKREQIERGNWGKPKAQAEMDEFVASLDDGANVSGTPSAKTMAKFDADMDQIEAFAESLRQKYGLDPDYMPTMNYTLRRGTGDTKYRIPFTGAVNPTPKGPKTQFGVWRANMMKGRSGMSPSGPLPTAATPSVGKAARFADVADARPAKADPKAQAVELMDEFDADLPADVEDAVSSFVGHRAGKKNQPVDFTNAFGIMDAKPLEAAARGENPALAAKIEAAFAPVREKLRAIYGDTVKLYRVQRPVEGRGKDSAPGDGQRAILSWTLDPDFANEYSGAKKDAGLYTDEQIEAVVAEYEATGEATVPGTRKRFVNESATGEGIGLYSGQEYITGFYDDVQEIRDYMRDTNTDRTEFNGRNAAARETIVSEDVALDDVMLATDRAGQLEFVVRNTEGSAQRIDSDGKRPAKAEPLMDRGAYEPAFTDVSKTKGASPFETAWRDAGLTPDEGTNLPAAQKVNVLTRVVSQLFGMKVARDAAKPLKAIDAVNQLLDAHQNLRFMAHVLGLGAKALGLNGTLSLSLEAQNRRYLGAYNHGTRTIHMPGRSNSFAHEWGHALDGYLRELLTPGSQQYLLTRVARDEGLDPTNSIQEAFVTLLNRMFYNDAALALRMMDLEAKAAAVDANGQPTAAAIKASEELAKLAEGNSQLRIKPTAYRDGARAYDGGTSGYFSSVHEMFARAFEAYVGFRMEQAGATSSAFVSKGDAAYLSDADARLALTFPKATERAMIFEAFDQIFHHIRTSAVLGTDPAEAKPTTDDMFDPAYWQKLDLARRDDSLLGALKQEFTAVKNGLTRMVVSPIATLKSTTASTVSALGWADGGAGKSFQTVADWARWTVYSIRGFSKLLIGRQPQAAQPFLRFAMGAVMTDPGTGSVNQKFTVEEEAERASMKVGSEVSAVLRVNGIELSRLTGGLTKADADAVRGVMLGLPGAGGAASHIKSIAAALRRIMDRTYLKATEAGLEMGYVENQGYLPRVVRAAEVNTRPAEFRVAATKVYEIHFRNITDRMKPQDLIDLTNLVARRVDPFNGARNGVFAGPLKAYRAGVRAVAAAQKAGDLKAEKAAKAALPALRQALLDVVEPYYASTSAEMWMRRIQIGSGLTFDSVGPDADFKAKRGLPKEAEEIMGDFFESDPIDQVLDYVHSVTRRATYQERLGVENREFDTVDSILGRREVKDAISGNPSKYNPSTPTGRLNIIRDLTDTARDNIKEMALEEARRNGADPEAIVDLRGNIEAIAGSNGGRRMPHLERATTAVYVWGTLMLLPRAAITSLTEPITFMMKTGRVRHSGRVFALYLREAIRGAKSVKELAALAEMVGVVATPLHDVVMLNRVSDGNQSGSAGNLVMSRFFRSIGLTQLTNAQRRAVLAGGVYMMRDLAKTYLAADAASIKGKAQRASIAADFRDYGVPSENVASFVKWLAAKDGLPSLDDLATPEGVQFQGSLARFVDTTIQNPRRADKTMLALSPYGRLVFGLTSFVYAFTRNVHAATVLRGNRDAVANLNIRLDAGQGPLQATFGATKDAFGDVAIRLGGGFGMMIFAQFLVGAVRAAIFDADQWEEKEKDDELYAWLLGLAVSRSTIAGPTDVLLQSVTGLRYERDLTSLTAGAHLGFLLSNMQNMLNASPQVSVGPYGIGQRNSANTQNAEHTGAKAFYRTVLAPTAAALLAITPTPGPISGIAKGAMLQGATSGTTADAFADLFFEKKKKKGE